VIREEALKILRSYKNNDPVILVDGKLVEYTNNDVEEAFEVAIKALKQEIVIPDNATNGDVLCKLFPAIKVDEYEPEDDDDCYKVVAWFPEWQKLKFSGRDNWWNAPYNEPLEWFDIA
jgi:hypothetical protein